MNHPASNTQRRLADLGLFYSAAVWGSTFFIVKDALDGIHPVALVAYRFLIAGVLLAGHLVLKRRSITADWRRGVFLGVIIYVLYIAQTAGLSVTTASNSGFITGLFVAFVPLFMPVIVGRRPTTPEIIAAVVALCGLWVLTGGLSDMNAGDLLTLLAAVTYALHVLYSDRYMKQGMNPIVLTCQQFLTVGVLSLLTALLLRIPMNTTGSRIWPIILFLALFPTLSAFVIQLFAQRIVSPLRVSLIFAFEPVFAALFAWTLGGEEFVTRRALGGLLVVAALVISGLPTAEKTRQDH